MWLIISREEKRDSTSFCSLLRESMISEKPYELIWSNISLVRINYVTWPFLKLITVLRLDGCDCSRFHRLSADLSEMWFQNRAKLQAMLEKTCLLNIQPEKIPSIGDLKQKDSQKWNWVYLKSRMRWGAFTWSPSGEAHGQADSGGGPAAGAASMGWEGSMLVEKACIDSVINYTVMLSKSFNLWL